jgi:nucleoside-diphosphate-sugar epimerase
VANIWYLYNTREDKMRVLFIGGTGIISSACVQLAIDRGIDLVLINRGQSTRPLPTGVKISKGDVRDPASVRRLVGTTEFDAVVNWVAYTPEHVETDLELFRGRTRQYIFISSASVYHIPPLSLPITESTPLYNPYWAYSRAKIACEERLVAAYRQEGFPVTIVRPSHTYDRTSLPMHGQYTVLDRMRKGKKVVVHGDGTSLWVMTHHRDFAIGFIGLLGNSHAIGEAVHITSDEILTWNQMFELVAGTAGAEAQLVHVPSDLIAAYDENWGASLLGDKTHSKIFDNTKIKRLVPDFVASIPYSRGVEEIVAYYDNNPAVQQVNTEIDRLFDRIITDYESIRPTGASA